MNILVGIMNWITSRRAWATLTKRFISKLNVRLLGDPKFPMKHWYQIEATCKANPNKLLVFVSNGAKLSSVMIRWISGARWTHAGVIRVTSDGRIKIVHMESTGLLIEPLLSLLRLVDDFALIEIPLSPEELTSALSIMDSYVQHKPGYDFQFLLDNKGLYCSELIYEMVEKTGRFKTHSEQGRAVFEPEDVAKMGEVLFEYKSR
jgi:hypothetical protein